MPEMKILEGLQLKHHYRFFCGDYRPVHRFYPRKDSGKTFIPIDFSVLTICDPARHMIGSDGSIDFMTSPIRVASFSFLAALL